MNGRHQQVGLRGPTDAAGAGRWRLIAGCWLALVSSGCVLRSLTIKTDPPGALVYVNDELKGKSPVQYDFMWYGSYRVTVRKDGYERLDDHPLIRSPVYLWIPFDFFMELAPWRIRQTYVWSYTLTPSPTASEPEPAALIPSAQDSATPGSALAIAPEASEGGTASIAPTAPEPASPSAPPPTTPTEGSADANR